MSLDPSHPDETRYVEEAIALDHARKRVEDAAAAARLVGGVFVLLGVVVLAAVLRGLMRGGSRWLAVANVVILIGPGVWYFFAATLLRRLDPRAATVALRVAAAQGVAVAAGLVTSFVWNRSDLSEVAIPAMFAIFFMPALAALSYHLWHARSAMNALGGGPLGFALLAPRPVIQLREGEAPAGTGSRAGMNNGAAGAPPFRPDANPSNHRIDSSREK
jgi:hypothetical protein